ERGWEVVIATSGDGKRVTRDNYNGLPVYHLPRRGVVSNTPLGKGWRRTLRRIIADERPDVVVAHGPVTSMLAATSRAVGKKLPLIITYHMGTLQKGRRMLDLIIAT